MKNTDLMHIEPLELYVGNPYRINDQVICLQPKIGDIVDYGESAYFSVVHTVCATPADMMEKVMAGFAPQILDEHTVGYRCNCSVERTERTLISLGREELQRLIDEDESAEVICQFCNKKYQVDLRELIKKM